MDDAIQGELESRLAEFRRWFVGRVFNECRLVQYCGIDLLGTKSIAPIDAEQEIADLLREGFHVDWTEHQDRLYLRVWECHGPQPVWDKVFAEEPLADGEAILRQARGLT